jgi:hypothetical protein
LKWVAILTILPRLVGRGAGSLAAFLRARRRAARTFRRALRDDGLPPEVVSQLTADYHSMLRLRRRSRDERSRGG